MTMYDESLQLLAQRRVELDPHDYNIVFMGDSWVGDKAYTSNEIFRSAMTEAQKYNPLMIIHGGDLVFNGETENFNYFRNLKNAVAPAAPLFVSIGNHDMDKRLTGDAAVANFTEAIGPLHFTLDLPEYHLTLIALDSLTNHSYHNYGLLSTELEYLRDNLKERHQNTFVSMHVPPRTDEWVPKQGDDTFFTMGSKAFFDEVAGKVDAVLVSHLHAYKTTKYRHTRIYLSGGSGAALYKQEIFHIIVINVRFDTSDRRWSVSYWLVPIGRG
jgi:predicted MPP superfamily phosphohydrolase